MTAKKSKKTSIKVDDVSKPGETPASSNARPTITGHSPMVKNDPMVAFSSKNGTEPQEEEKEKEDQEEDTQQNQEETYRPRTKLKINPISEGADKDEEKEEPEKPKEEAEGEKASESEEKPEEKPQEKPNDANSSESATIEAIAQTADSKKSSSKETEEEKKRQEHIDELAKSGKYQLPIIEGGHKGSAERIVSWIFLLLLVASIGVYLAIDAGYVDIGFGLPFEFIGN